MKAKTTNLSKNCKSTNTYQPLVNDAKIHKQNSNYANENKPVPDNNVFFEERSNPLSSKGN